MASPKKKEAAKHGAKFKDLKAKRNPKGGFSFGASNDKRFLNPQPLPP